jgi:predicted CXXCH cytochrome family protein
MRVGWVEFGGRTGLAWLLIVSALVMGGIALGGVLQTPTVMAAQSDTTVLENPDAVCASCHQEIYARYERTSMARGSGAAMEALVPGTFHHAASHVDYKVFARDGAGWMAFSRSAEAGGALQGEERLRYFIGSGHRGRTYLYVVDGQWFELPINYYTRRSVWDMAPAFDNVTAMPAPLPVDPNCLHCHATEVQPSQMTARNRFVGGVPFKQGGMGCSACHGDAAAHLAAKGYGSIVNPAKLSASRRDSACIQCHLEGDAVVYRPGKSLAQFKAGDDLADTAVYFVRASQQSGGARATSQYEALLKSACKRATGDKLTCTTCHDPHSDPAPAERVAYFRAKCLSCHTGADMVTHHTEQPDCATCHMPTRSTVDISHEQVTDHDIEARPATPTPAKATDALVPVGNFAAGDRELGLAYAQMAQRGDARAGPMALELLSKAALAGANDEEMETRLGYLLQTAHQSGQARAAYTLALTADPYEPAALANLAVLDASEGRIPEAVRLLERLTNAEPSQTAAGLNLAFIECRLGHKPQARGLVERLARVHPDDPALRGMLRSGTYGGQHCSLSDAP